MTRVPFVAQQTETECGVACVTMTLAYHGKVLRLDEVRDVVGADRDGTNARIVLDGARRLGLSGRAVKLDAAKLGQLPAGTILHWAGNHFVVVDRTSQRDLARGRIALVDPAYGPRLVEPAELARAFSGVALVLEPGPDFVRSTRVVEHPLARVARLASGHTAGLVRVVLLSAVLQALALSLPLVTGVIVDRIVPRADPQLLGLLGLGLAVVTIAHLATSLLRARVLLRLRTELDARLTLGFLRHLMSLPYGFFLQRTTGDLMMRLNSNATIREVLTSSAVSGLFDGALVSLYLVVLGLVSWKMALLVAAIGALQVTAFLVTRRRAQALLAMNLEAQARAEGFEVQMLGGIETLKAAGTETRAVEQFTSLFHETLAVQTARGKLDGWVASIGSTLHLAGPLAVLACGTTLVLQRELSLGTMLGIDALAVGLLVPLASLLSTATQLQLLGTYVDRLDDVLRVAPEQDATRARPAPTLMGALALDTVDFRYSPHGPLVLEDVSLSIAPGELVALVGPSGSGKSTLAHLLLGLFMPTRGSVRLDGIDLAELDLRSVRLQLGVVTQRPHLFGRSVRDVIAMSDPRVTFDEVVDAARLAQIHDEILALKMGYETPLTNGGASLSGGQRQRLALARALVRRPRIVLLDEATSALDTATETKIRDAIAGLEATRVVIAHRLSTIQHADRIVVVVGGRIVQTGTHAQLSAVAGAYRELIVAAS